MSGARRRLRGNVGEREEVHTATHPGARLARKGEKPDEAPDGADERAEVLARLDEEADEEGPEP